MNTETVEAVSVRPGKRQRLQRDHSKGYNIPVMMFPEEIIMKLIGHVCPHGKTLYFLTLLHPIFARAINCNVQLWYSVLVDIENQRLQTTTCAKYMLRYLPVQSYPGISDDLQLAPVPDFRARLHKHVLLANDPEKRTWPPCPVLEYEKPALARHAYILHVLKFQPTCSMCQAKYSLLSVWGLGKKVCDACFRDNIVCNNSLFSCYGIDFWKLYKNNTLDFSKIFCFTIECHNGVYRYQLILNTLTLCMNVNHTSPCKLN